MQQITNNESALLGISSSQHNLNNSADNNIVNSTENNIENSSENTIININLSDNAGRTI